MASFESLGTVSYSPSIVTMTPTCIISEIKRDVGRKSRYFHTRLAFYVRGRVIPSEYCHRPIVWYGKTIIVVRLPGGTKIKDMFSSVDRIPYV